jgi:hypothetical protein
VTALEGLQGQKYAAHMLQACGLGSSQGLRFEASGHLAGKWQTCIGAAFGAADGEVYETVSSSSLLLSSLE